MKIKTAGRVLAFSALPGGYRDSSDGSGVAGYYGCWWTATEYDESDAYHRRMDFSHDHVIDYYCYKNYAFSVRCVDD
jgi:uncharacterized protein (TIGR02145 family)